MSKLKVIDLIILIPILFVLFWAIQSACGKEEEESSSESESKERDQESIKVSVSRPDDDKPRILSLDPYSPPSIVNDVHDRMSNDNGNSNNLPSNLNSNLNGESENVNHGQVNNGQTIKKQLTNVKEFQELLKTKRALLVQAIKGLINIPRYEKRFEMVTKIFSKIFQLQQESKSIIENR